MHENCVRPLLFDIYLYVFRYLWLGVAQQQLQLNYQQLKKYDKFFFFSLKNIWQLALAAWFIYQSTI